MLKLSGKLCDRSMELSNKYNQNPLPLNSSIETLLNQTLDLQKKSQIAVKENKLYPAASFCFRANIDLEKLII